MLRYVDRAGGSLKRNVGGVLLLVWQGAGCGDWKVLFLALLNNMQALSPVCSSPHEICKKKIEMEIKRHVNKR